MFYPVVNKQAKGTIIAKVPNQVYMNIWFCIVTDDFTSLKICDYLFICTNSIQFQFPLHSAAILPRTPSPRLPRALALFWERLALLWERLALLWERLHANCDFRHVSVAGVVCTPKHSQNGSRNWIPYRQKLTLYSPVVTICTTGI